MKNIHVWELLPWDVQVDILSRLSTKDLRNVESVCKDWQCIIKSPRFHMLQINANLNQDAIIMDSMNDIKKPIIQSLSSNDINKFLNPIVDSASCHDYDTIVAVSNGLVLVKFYINNQFDIPFLVCNPITKEYVKLPQFSKPLYYLEIICDFFEHDLQSSSYKIIVIGYREVRIYSSSSHCWQTFNDSFSNFTSNFQYVLWNPFSCITYKNNIYVAFQTSIYEWMIATSIYEWMIAVYNPVNDVWNNFNQNHEMNCKLNDDDGRLIIANDRLFFAQVCYPRRNTFLYNNKSISIFEINIENRLLIPITKIIQPQDMEYNRYLTTHCIFGLNNKIIIVGFMKDLVITFDVSSNEQEEIGYNNIIFGYHYTKNKSTWNYDHIYPFKYTLVSP